MAKRVNNPRAAGSGEAPGGHRTLENPRNPRTPDGPRPSLLKPGLY